jgi:nitrous oxide reductase accessory protein NosL
MKRLLLAFLLAASTLAGCAQFADSAAPAGATGVEEQSPYPTRFRNDNRHPA